MLDRLRGDGRQALARERAIDSGRTTVVGDVITREWAARTSIRDDKHKARTWAARTKQ